MSKLNKVKNSNPTATTTETPTTTTTNNKTKTAFECFLLHANLFYLTAL